MKNIRNDEHEGFVAAILTFLTVVAIAIIVTFITHPEIFHFKK